MKPQKVQAGDQLSAAWLNKLVDAVPGQITGTGGVTVSQTPGGVTIAPPGPGTRSLQQAVPFAAQITANTPANDYISVKRVLPDDTLATDAIEVAKPYTQRGERYPLEAGDRVIVYPVARTGTTGSGADDLRFVVEFALPTQPADGNTYTIECGTDGSLSWELTGECS